MSVDRFMLLTILMSFSLFVGCTTSLPRTRPAPKVLTEKVDKRDVPIYFDAIGQAIAPITVQVRPLVGGRLLQAYVKQGDDVRQGDALYTIDPRPFQASLEEANAQLRKDEALLWYAEKTVERYKKVVEEDYISQSTFEQYESQANAAREQVKLDKAAVALAELNLEYCNIKAPVDGKISYFAVDVGNIVIANDPTAITVIRPNSPIDVSFSIPQSQFEMIRRNQGDAGIWRFIATLPENPKVTFEGETYFLDNQVDQDTGTILLRGRFANEKLEFWPGEFIKVQVLNRVAPDALVVSPGAVLMGQKGAYVYIVNADKKAIPINVNVLTRTEEYIALTSDQLKKGDIVVTEGQINIASGMVVEMK